MRHQRFGQVVFGQHDIRFPISPVQQVAALSQTTPSRIQMQDGRNPDANQDLTFYATSSGVPIRGRGGEATVLVLPFDVPVAPSGFEYHVASFATWTVNVIFTPTEPRSLLGFEDAMLAPRLEFKLHDGTNVNFAELDYETIGRHGAISSKFTPTPSGARSAILSARILIADIRSTITIDGTILVRLRLVKIPAVVNFAQPVQRQPQTSVPLGQARLNTSVAIPNVTALPGDIGFGVPPAPPQVPRLFSVPQNVLPASRLAGRVAGVGPGVAGVGQLSPIQRTFAVSQMMPAPILAPNAPAYNRQPEQVQLDPSTVQPASLLPGLYRVVSPNLFLAVVSNGVNVHSMLIPGTVVRITADQGQGWYRISEPLDGIIGEVTAADLVSIAPTNPLLAPLDRVRPNRIKPNITIRGYSHLRGRSRGPIG